MNTRRLSHIRIGKKCHQKKDMQSIEEINLKWNSKTTDKNCKIENLDIIQR